jgi:D-glycerate 3-kinase
LGEQTLAALKCLTAGAELTAPLYDKSQHGGRGDRLPREAWRKVTGPVDIVLLEGWMLGFKRMSSTQQSAQGIDKYLVEVDRAIEAYDSWYKLMDAWVILKIADPAWVYTWRMQAEANMKAAGKTGLTEAETRDYIDRFMPAYRAYLPGLYQFAAASHLRHSASAWQAGVARSLCIEIGLNRLPL